MNTTCNSNEFFTDKWYYTIINTPCRRDFTKKIIKGSSQADAALIFDRKLTTTTDKRYLSAGEIQGQTRQHSRPSKLLRMKQTYNDANEMDFGTAGCKHEWCEEISNDLKNILIKCKHSKTVPNFNVRCSFLYKQFHFFCL